MNYTGQFEIIAGDGATFNVTGSFRKTVRNGVESWGGTATGDPSSMGKISQDDEARVRLPDGSEGSAMIANVVTHADRTGLVVVLTLDGTGDAPF